MQRGFTRRATQTFEAVCGAYSVQATMWKDRKIVGWLHSLAVSDKKGKAKRRTRGNPRAKEFDAPEVQREYAQNFRGVDIADQDGAHWSISLRSCRWYLRIFFWMLERVAHATYIIACHASESGSKHFLKPYKSKHNGRKRFQIHLGIALINAAIESEWKPREDGKYHEKDKPKWMPKTETKGKYWPCDCGICFFCKNEFTSGITHGKLTARPKERPPCNPEMERMPGTKRRCEVCLRMAQDKHPGKTIPQLKAMNLMRQSVYGCINCEEWVCKECWGPRYKHKAERRGQEKWWQHCQM